MKAKYSLAYSLLSPTQRKKLVKKSYRDAFMDSQVRTWLARQIRLLRDQRGWSQTELAELIGKPQSVVSRLEDPDYGRMTVSTLIKISNAFDIGLSVQFCDFDKAVFETRDVSKKAFDAQPFDEQSLELGSDQTVGSGETVNSSNRKLHIHFEATDFNKTVTSKVRTAKRFKSREFSLDENENKNKTHSSSGLTFCV